MVVEQVIPYAVVNYFSEFGTLRGVGLSALDASCMAIQQEHKMQELLGIIKQYDVWMVEQAATLYRREVAFDAMG